MSMEHETWVDFSKFKERIKERKKKSTGLTIRENFNNLLLNQFWTHESIIYLYVYTIKIQIEYSYFKVRRKKKNVYTSPLNKYSKFLFINGSMIYASHALFPFFQISPAKKIKILFQLYCRPLKPTFFSTNFIVNKNKEIYSSPINPRGRV